MKKLLALLLCTPLMAQQIAPRQIAPGLNGQTLQTVGGVTTWANSSVGGASISFTSQTTVTMAFSTYGFFSPIIQGSCYDTSGNSVEFNGPQIVSVGTNEYSVVFGFAVPQTGTCVAIYSSAGIPSDIYLPLAGGTLTGGANQVLAGTFNGTFYQPNLWLMGGMTQSIIEQMQGYTTGPLGSVADVFSCGQLIPVGALGQIDCYGSYQRSLQSGASDGPNPVGFYARTVSGTNNGTIWGGNYNLTDEDYDGTIRTGTTEFGLELDCNVTSATTAGACIYLNGDFSAQPGNLGAIHISSEGANGWSYGLIADDGAIPSGTAMTIGTTSTNASSPSDTIYFHSRDSANTELRADISVSSPNSGSTQFNIDANKTMVNSLLVGLPTSASTPAVQFQSSGVTNLYDAEIIASGGSSTTGQGTVQYLAATHDFSGTVNVPVFSVSSGVVNSTGLQHLRFTGCSTTGGAVGSTCTATGTWSVAFPDANYTPACSLETPTAVPALGAVTKTATVINVTLVEMTTSNAGAATIDCIAVHD